MQKINDAVYFIVDKLPKTPNMLLVWVDADDCAAEVNYTIYLSPDNRTRGEREPLFQRLSDEMKELIPYYNKTLVCFASTDYNTASFAALLFAGLCGQKLAPIWSKYIETIDRFDDGQVAIDVPKFYNTNASFRLILTRFK